MSFLTLAYPQYGQQIRNKTLKRSYIAEKEKERGRRGRESKKEIYFKELAYMNGGPLGLKSMGRVGNLGT